MTHHQVCRAVAIANFADMKIDSQQELQIVHQVPQMAVVQNLLTFFGL
jgi:hypothetical protein